MKIYMACHITYGGHKLAPCVTDHRLLLSGFQALVTLTLILDRVIWHTAVHHPSTSTHIPNYIEIGKTLCGRTDISPSNVIRSTLGGVDLKIYARCLKATVTNC